MSTTSEVGQVTGTRDKNYNLIWYTEQCLDDAMRMETYTQDAERDGDNELAELFGKAQADSKKGAEEAHAFSAAGSSSRLSPPGPQNALPSGSASTTHSKSSKAKRQNGSRTRRLLNIPV